jgi:ABC-type amino acid transport substrate-binding protein
VVCQPDLSKQYPPSGVSLPEIKFAAWHKFCSYEHGEADLRYVRVAAIAGTDTTEYLDRERISYQAFGDAEAGLSALQKGQVDALVYDRPPLLWLVNGRFFSSLQVLDATFDPAGLCDRTAAGQRATDANQPRPARRHSE